MSCLSFRVIEAYLNKWPVLLQEEVLLLQLMSTPPLLFFVIAYTWTFPSSFSQQPFWHKTLTVCFCLFSIPVPVLPSPLPASPSPPSPSGTRWTTGSRASPSVCTGTWGRSRTTSAQRTRSSEAASTIFKVSSKVSGLLSPKSVLAWPCSVPFCLLWIGGGGSYQTLFRKVCHNNVAFHKY